jgi:hypothetical protein
MKQFVTLYSCYRFKKLNSSHSKCYIFSAVVVLVEFWCPQYTPKQLISTDVKFDVAHSSYAYACFVLVLQLEFDFILNWVLSSVHHITQLQCPLSWMNYMVL